MNSFKRNVGAGAVMLALIATITTSAFTPKYEDYYVQTSNGFERLEDAEAHGSCQMDGPNCKYTLDNSNPSEPIYVPVDDNQIWVED